MNRSLTQRLCIGAVVLFVAAGCGSDDEGTSEDPVLEETVRSYSADFLAGDATAAYARMSDRCHTVLEEEVFASVVETIAEAYPDEEITDFESDVDGNSATVSYEYSDDNLDQEDEPWVYEGGEWHIDDC
jgi:hypothetical protein